MPLHHSPHDHRATAFHYKTRKDDVTIIDLSSQTDLLNFKSFLIPHSRRRWVNIHTTVRHPESFNVFTFNHTSLH